MPERRKQQKPYRGGERRAEPFDYRIRRDQRIVNVACLGLAGCLGAVVAGVGDTGGIIALATIFGGLLAIPKFLEWDERPRREEPDEGS